VSIIEKALDKLAREDGQPAVQAHDDRAVAADPRTSGEERAQAGAQTPGPASASSAASGDNSREPLQSPTHGAPGEAPAPGTNESDRPQEPDQFVSLDSLQLEGFISLQGERSRTAEEFRMIKRPVLIKAFEQEDDSDKPRNLVMVTSALASEGKTFVSLNLALSIAQELDKTILLVDADVAKPGLSRLLALRERRGLLDLLTDPDCQVGDVLVKTEMPKLSIVPAGPRHSHSTELLASKAMKDLLWDLAHRYPDRLVLFDSPPLLATTEASVLARHMGQIVVVVEADSTSQSVIKEALSQFDSLEDVSCVLNKCRPKFGFRGYGGYYYQYHYGRYYGNYGE
jgi:exopolysaccharide/PEP-CTERM locus tyrosine autokinase